MSLYDQKMPLSLPTKLNNPAFPSILDPNKPPPEQVSIHSSLNALNRFAIATMVGAMVISYSALVVLRYLDFDKGHRLLFGLIILNMVVWFWTARFVKRMNNKAVNMLKRDDTVKQLLGDNIELEPHSKSWNVRISEQRATTIGVKFMARGSVARGNIQVIATRIGFPSFHWNMTVTVRDVYEYVKPKRILLATSEQLEKKIDLEVISSQDKIKKVMNEQEYNLHEKSSSIQSDVPQVSLPSENSPIGDVLEPSVLKTKHDNELKS